MLFHLIVLNSTPKKTAAEDWVIIVLPDAPIWRPVVQALINFRVLGKGAAGSTVAIERAGDIASRVPSLFWTFIADVDVGATESGRNAAPFGESRQHSWDKPPIPTGEEWILAISIKGCCLKFCRLCQISGFLPSPRGSLGTL